MSNPLIAREEMARQYANALYEQCNRDLSAIPSFEDPSKPYRIEYWHRATREWRLSHHQFNTSLERDTYLERYMGLACDNKPENRGLGGN